MEGIGKGDRGGGDRLREKERERGIEWGREGGEKQRQTDRQTDWPTERQRKLAYFRICSIF